MRSRSWDLGCIAVESLGFRVTADFDCLELGFAVRIRIEFRVLGFFPGWIWGNSGFSA